MGCKIDESEDCNPCAAALGYSCPDCGELECTISRSDESKK